VASLEKHKEDCLKWIGADFESVHEWLDEFLAVYGPGHRKFRHHREGIEEARRLFGDEGAAAATLHILRDCRNIPKEGDYESGTVDALGLRREWPVAAYARYTEEAFRALATHKLYGPSGTILWGFLGNVNEVGPLLSTLTRTRPEEMKSLLEKWRPASEYRLALPPLPSAEGKIFEVTGEVRSYLDEFRDKPIFGVLGKQYGGAEFAYVPTDELITPLLIIDYEYVEALRAEMKGEDELSTANFAAPRLVTTEIKGAVDTAQRSFTCVSTEKTLNVGGLRVQEIPGTGLEVTFVVTSAAAMIMVSQVGERLYLRSGIHRAYLLASMGKKKIPCILVRESQVSALAAAYPCFAPSVLAQPRPPLLRDFLDERLALTVPLQRTHKVVRIAAQDFTVPVD
jgi:hypothetical protein